MAMPSTSGARREKRLCGFVSGRRGWKDLQVGYRGQMNEIAVSETEFRHLAQTKEKRQQWFAEKDELAAGEHGLKPNQNQCIAFKIPIVFAEAGTPNNAYVGSLYEQVSFLGDLNRQLSQVPDGSKVQLRIQK